MPNTEDMHFRMIHERKFDFVLSFTNEPKKESFAIDEVYNFKGLALKVLGRSMLNKNLCRSEVNLFNTNETGNRYEHNFIQYEFDAWPNGATTSLEAIELLVKSICIIRNEMELKKSSLKILATDFRGGVGPSAVFLAMYQLMQCVDESITHDNQLKQSAQDVDVFSIVNQLRKDRDKMIEDFSTYQLLFKCLEYYGSNIYYCNQGMQNTVTKRLNGQRSVRTEWASPSGSRDILRASNTSDVGAEYVLHKPEGDDGDIFENYYCDQKVVFNHKYQNIEEMSEYL